MAAVKIFATLADRRNGLLSYQPSFDRLGVVVTHKLDEADGVLCLSDSTACAAAGHPRFMPRDSLDIVLTRDRLPETGLPTLPTTVITTRDEAPAGSFVKTRNSAQGGFVYQPHLGFPQTDLDISFSVGPDGFLMPFTCQRLIHHGHKKPTDNVDPDPIDVDWALSELRAACARLAIKGGVHNVQFLRYNEQWCVTDWNPRPAFIHTEGLAAMHPYMDRPLAHMLGLPLPEETGAVVVTRGYWSKPLPQSLATVIRSLGLMPRRRGDVLGFTRVSGVGGSRSEVEAKFAELEKHL